MTKTTVKRDLPKGILVSDLKYPESKIKWKSEMSKEDERAYEDEYKRNRIVHTFEFYKTERFGWVMLTLHISNASRRQSQRGVDTRRSYAVPVNDPNSIVRVGLGPHVTDKFTLYIRQERLDALKDYVALNDKGMGSAGEVRDRISTRRAQGQMHRANGERSWRW